MRKAIRETLEIVCAALNRMEELEQSERDPMRRADLQRVSHLLTRARGYLIEEDRKEAC